MPYNHSLRLASIQALTGRVQDRVYTTVAPLELEAWVTPEPVPFGERTAGTPVRPQVGQSWGKLWDCAWFRFRGTVPDRAGGLPTVLRIDLSGELCVFSPEGEPLRGLTTYASEFDYTLGRPGKTEFPWSTASRAGEAVEIWADWFTPFVFNQRTELQTIASGIVRSTSSLLSQHAQPNWPELIGEGVVLNLPCIVIFLAFQKNIVAGLTSSAVKG